MSFQEVLINLLHVIAGSLITVVGQIILNHIKHNLNYPKFKLFSLAVKTQTITDYFFIYYSKIRNRFFLIARINVLNTGSKDGSLNNVFLCSKSKSFGKLITQPISQKEINYDPILSEFINSEIFINDALYTGSVTIPAQNNKVVAFVFDVTQHVTINKSYANEYSLIYNKSVNKISKRILKFNVPGSCLTDHYTLKQIIEIQNQANASKKTNNKKKAT